MSSHQMTIVNSITNSNYSPRCFNNIYVCRLLSFNILENRFTVSDFPIDFFSQQGLGGIVAWLGFGETLLSYPYLILSLGFIRGFASASLMLSSNAFFSISKHPISTFRLCELNSLLLASLWLSFVDSWIWTSLVGLA